MSNYIISYDKLFILAGFFMMLSVTFFYFVSYQEIINEFPKYDPISHKYIPKSEITRQEEMRFNENFPNFFYIIFIRPAFLYFACFSVVFFMLWFDVDIPIFKDIKKRYDVWKMK